MADPLLNGHLMRNLLEDAHFLLDGGEHLSTVARRLGIKQNTLKKYLEQERNGQCDTHAVQRTREAARDEPLLPVRVRSEAG